MGSDLPPGVSVNDIPGNRPEDEAYERFLEQLLEKLHSEGYALSQIEMITESKVGVAAINIAYSIGVSQGYEDSKHAQEVADEDKQRLDWEAEQQNMAEAHAEGMHDELAREGCPECVEYRR